MTLALNILCGLTTEAYEHKNKIFFLPFAVLINLYSAFKYNLTVCQLHFYMFSSINFLMKVQTKFTINIRTLTKCLRN